jgi:peroxiredoxin
MRFIIVCFRLVIFFLLLNGQIVSAQFLEAGVQQSVTPVDAPDFTMKDSGGRKISLKELRGKVVVLNFFSVWCSVCEKQASSFDKLDKEVMGKDVGFLHVAVEGREKDLLEYKSKFYIPVPILIDEDGSVAKAYGIQGTMKRSSLTEKERSLGKHSQRRVGHHRPGCLFRRKSAT